MPVQPTISVLVHHCDPIVSAGLIASLRDRGGVTFLAPERAENYPSNWTCDLVASVIVTDYDQGIEFLKRIKATPARRQIPPPAVFILTPRQSEVEIRHALSQGARGYLILGCGPEDIFDGIRAVLDGRRHIGAEAAECLADSVSCEKLTLRETDVLRLVVEGMCNKTIAKKLDISIGTVKSHLKAIFQKLDARTRTEVAAVATRRGLLSIPPNPHPDVKHGHAIDHRTQWRAPGTSALAGAF